MNHTTVDLTDGLTALHARLAALAEEQPRTAAVVELRLIRERLRGLAAANAELDDRLGESLGLKQPPRRHSG